MKKIYIVLLMAILLSGITFAQEAQKNFINYQGVARNGADQLMANESMTIGIALKMGSATGASGYAENHSVNTDANGVFSLKIGNGDAVSGEYNSIPWGSEATFVTVLINGSEIGTTEMMAVPYALSSGDGSQTATEVPYDNGISGLAATNAQQAIDELVGSGAVDADADPGNELQNLSLDGTTLEISDGTGVDLAALIPPGGTDDQNASEVPFDNSTSTLTATDTQAALVELATGGLVDTDDQDLSLTGTLLQISDGTGVDLAPIIPPGGTDDQNAVEVPYDNTVSALVATDTQAAIDELASGVIGGTSLWELNGGDINYGTGNVGINTVTPAARLDIKHNSTLAIPQLRLEETEVDYARLEFKNDATGFWHIAGRGGDTGDVSRLNFYHHNGTVGRDLMTIAGSGNIGIGTTAPTAKAHVQHNSNLASPQLRLEESSNDYSRLELKNQSTGFWHVAGRGGDTGDVSRLNFYHHNGTVGRDLMTIAGSGNVGIGTTSPQAPFDIAGQNNWDLNTTEGDFRMGNDTYRLKMGTALGGAGAGNARIRSQGGSNKLLLGSGNLDVLSIVDTNVGIGTIDPTIELDVVGSIRSSDLSGAGQRNVMADTDGNLIIGAGGGGGSLWTENADGVFYNDGLVGIGTDSPKNLQHIHSELGFESTTQYTTGLTGSNFDDGLHVGMVSTLDGFEGQIYNEEATALRLGTNSRDRLSILGNGNVGIGAYYPSTNLEVAGTGTVRSRMTSTDAGTVSLQWLREGDANTDWMFTAGSSGMELVYSPSDFSGSTVHTRLSDDGLLEVTGSIRSGELAGTGQRNVLADADGNLIIGAGGGGGSLWTQDGSNINYTSGRVGIGSGSESSNAVLEVAGGANSEGILNVKDTELVGRNLAISGFGLQGRFDGANSNLMLNRSGGDVFIGNGETTVGIGLTGFSVPESTLDVNGDIRSRNLSGPGNRNVMADTDGNLVIGAAVGGSSLWTQDGSNINYTSGDVGIGTPDPTAKAHVLHDSNIANPQLRLEESAVDYARLEFKNQAAGFWHIAGRGGDTGDVSRLNFYHHNGTIGRDFMTIAGSGNVGIGTTAPTAKLDVAGDIKTSGEVHGPTSGSANMIPIAYGNIGDDGSIFSGTGNFTVNRIAEGRYTISITGEVYNYNIGYTTVATRNTGTVGFIGTNALGSDLLVTTKDITGTDSDALFMFVVYKN